jgi:glycosyltransferase involved in cell wall biosynthesis
MALKIVPASQLPRVLVVHNAYQQRGGEDSVVEAEAALLQRAGHAVEIYRRDNAEVDAVGRLQLAADALWSRRTVADMARLVERFSPDLVHVHNTLPLISPSVYWAADRTKLPVVQTLHNFRLMCPQGMLLRREAICEDCVGKVPWRAVRYRCYRGSLGASAMVASTVALHRYAGTFRSKVARYIALNHFCRDKFVEAGLPTDRLRIKPNFVEVPRLDNATERAGGLFVGRLSAEKGLKVLIGALREYKAAQVSVVGTGELQGDVEAAIGERWLGQRSLPDILALMRRAGYLVLPSIWYENFPRTVVEAYGSGLPVIASRLGALPEIVIDGETGLLFEPGSVSDLARKLQWATEHPEEMARMGASARARYESLYTPEANYDMLCSIYAEAIADRASRE